MIYDRYNIPIDRNIENMIKGISGIHGIEVTDKVYNVHEIAKI